MPRFSANTSFLFTDLDFMHRFQAAKDAGFEAVEFHFPYSYDVERVVDAVKRSGVEVVLFNMPPGDWQKGERGIACLPDRVDEFQQGVEDAIRWARTLDVKRVNCLAGIAPENEDPDRVRETFVGNLRFAAEAMGPEGITVVTEPINTRTIPGFYLSTTLQALDLLQEVGMDNVKIQYDTFHMQIMEGDLAKTIEATLDKIGHIQIADVPDRNEPGTGEINFAFLFDWIDRIGYQGWIGAEYVPSKATVETLGWLKPYLRNR